MTRNQFAYLAFFASFLVLGVSATLFGPTLESLTTRFDIPLENGGIFFTIHSTGVTIAIYLVGKLFDSERYDPRYLLCIGPVLLFIGTFTLVSVQSALLAYGSAFVFGLGFGSILIGPNILVPAMNPGNAATGLNALNTFFGVGAIAGPQVVNIAFGLDNFAYAYVFTGLAALVTIPVFLSLSLPRPDLDAEPRQRPAVQWSLFIPFMIVLFFYVGTEVGFGAWIATQMTKVVGSDASTATIAVSMFWFGLTGGRALASIISRRMRPVYLLALAVAMIGIGSAVLLALAGNEAISILSAFIVGLGCGPVFPTTLAVVSTNYPEQYSAVSGTLVAIGNIGAMFIPWIQGQVGGGETGGISVTFTLSLVILAVVLTIIWQLRRTEARERVNA